ncbi:MAG: HAMP domain-containing histidine kinase [Bacteroidales bacterium]|nr:HAMP domain-containing histidine kinase [Bacteroidales bacterium]
MRTKTLLCLLLLGCAAVAPAAEPEHLDPKNILVICTHAEASDWSRDMLAPIYELESIRGDLQVYSSVLRMTMLSGLEELEERKQEIFEPFGSEGPDLTVLVGCAGFMLAEDIQAQWPGTPLILAGENDYYCDKPYTLRGGVDHDAARHPIIDLIRHDRANLTLVQTPSCIAETVELMQTLIPDMDTLVFISGENFQCREQQVRLENYLAEKQPELAYEAFYSYQHSTEELIAMLEARNPARTGVLFGSWLTHKGYQEAISARRNVGHIIEAAIPVFDIFGADMEMNKNLTGYYTYDHELYKQTMMSRITDVLDEGIAPRGMPFICFEAAYPTVNWASMEHFGMDTSLIPRNAVVYGRPPGFFQRNRRLLLELFAILLLTAAVAVSMLMRRKERQEEKARLQAEHANRMKTMFIQNMSHEVRTPLNAVLGFAQLLALPDGCNTEEEKAEYLSYVTNNAQMLTMLIGDILNISDVENGRYKITKAPADLAELCRMAIKTTEHRCQPGVTMEFVNGLPEGMQVETDGGRVQQLLVNLLSNACKHTSEGFIRLETSLAEHPGRVTFSVSDSGPGIPPDKAERIFERFVMLDHKVEGTGLGLNICRVIADNIGGEIFLDTSYPGGAAGADAGGAVKGAAGPKSGARFVVTIPL